MLVEFIPLGWKHSTFRPVSICTGLVDVVQLCRAGRGLVNLLLLAMNDIVVTQVSWRQKAPTLLLEELSCLPTAPCRSHDTTNPPPPPQGLCSHLLNNAMKKNGSGQSETRLFSTFHLLFVVRSEQEGWDCCWGQPWFVPGHDTVVLHAGRAWFLKRVNKTHLWTGFSNSGSCWVSLWKCISRL